MRLAALACCLLPGLSAALPSQSIYNDPALSHLYAGLQDLSSEHYDCLISHIKAYPQQRLVQLSPDSKPFVISEGEKALLVYHSIKFLDVTDDDSDAEVSMYAETASNFPANLTNTKEGLEKEYFSKIDTDNMLALLKHFTGFRTRYYRSSSGKDSQKWLLSTVKSIVSSRKDIKVSEVAHSWGQNSIIVHIPATGSSASEPPAVIIGAHQDSTNLLPFLPAPGADDDASGTITLLTVLGLLAPSFKPTSHPVEFHFYSAEEGGMLGSNEVVKTYTQANKKVRAMLQMDMTAYVKPGTQERIGVIQDFVDPSLTEYVKTLIDGFCDIPWVDTKCGYACSDHSSWTKVGAPSAFAIEATFEDSNTRNIHSTSDTINVDGYSLEHMKQFVKLSTAFLLELSE